MKKVFLGFFALTLVLTLGACNSKDEQLEDVTITIWHTYSEGEVVIFDEQVIPAFEAKYPHITIDSVRMPYDGLKQQVITGAAGDSAPDLMRMDIIWVPEFAKLGALEELDSYSGFDSTKRNLFGGPLQTNVYEGDYYGLPLNTNTKVAVYNKSLFDELGLTDFPETFDDLVALQSQLGEDEWAIGLSGTGSWGFLPYFWSMGGELTNDDYTKADGYLNSEDSIQAVEKLYQYYLDGKIGPAILGEQPDTWGGVGSGNYLMIDDGPWYYSIIGESALEGTYNAPLPEGDGGSYSVVGGENIVMFSTSEKKEAAWTFMKWLTTEEPQIMMSEVGMIPTNKDAANSDEAQTAPYIASYVEQLKTAKPRTPHPSWGQIDETFSLAIESVFRGEKDVEAALNEAAEKIESFLG
ncbi:extracellular solute-binding protein [Mycoplasmatota bacterium zrk1]